MGQSELYFTVNMLEECESESVFVFVNSSYLELYERN
jgi:hypothetical protein